MQTMTVKPMMSHTATSKNHENYFDACDTCRGALAGRFFVIPVPAVGKFASMKPYCSDDCLAAGMVEHKLISDEPGEVTITVAHLPEVDWDDLFTFNIETDDDSDEAVFAAMERLGKQMLEEMGEEE